MYFWLLSQETHQTLFLSEEEQTSEGIGHAVPKRKMKSSYDFFHPQNEKEQKGDYCKDKLDSLSSSENFILLHI